MNIKTVTTTDGVNTVDFGSAASRFYWFKNIGTTTVYVSGNSDISAGVDGVAELPSGGSVCIETLGGKVYILGEGKVQIHNTGDKFCPFRNAPVSGDGGKTATVSNPNLLINPDFKINQRGVSGVFSETGKYFVDRWRLVSGTVTVNSDKTLTINGSICQVLENSVGTNVTASVSAGTAVYDDTAKTFTITGNGDVISWAKLETGSAATPFIPPDPATEFLKCCRYFQIIDNGSPVFGIVTNSSQIRLTMPIICPMRNYPTACLLQHTGDFTWSFTIKNAAATSSFTTMDFSAMSVTFIRTDGAIMNVYINISHTLSTGEIVYTGGSGGIYFSLDAEIY